VFFYWKYNSCYFSGVSNLICSLSFRLLVSMLAEQSTFTVGMKIKIFFISLFIRIINISYSYTKLDKIYVIM